MTLLEKIRAAKAQAPVAPEHPKGSRFAAPNTRPEPWQVARQPLSLTLGRARPAVTKSDDLTRVLAIPRRAPLELDSPEAKAFAAEVTARFARARTTPCTCAPLPCVKTLNPIQAISLHEAGIVGGLIGNIGVGWGKTLLDILIALAIPGTRTAAVCVPPGLIGQLRLEYTRVAQHFHVPSLVLPNGGGTITSGPRAPWPVLHVVPYSKLSREEATTMISGLNPDLIVGDEAHRLANPDGAGASRVYRHYDEHPETKACFWSGTLTKKSIRDYARLCLLALGENSPLPIKSEIVEEWSLAIDPIDWQAPMGALSALCNPGEALAPSKNEVEMGKTYGYRRRLQETLGVVGTKGAAVDASITLHERHPPKMPAVLTDMLRQLRGEWVRPDGEELVDMMQVAKSARELACGFFYKWTFPKGEDPALIREWFEARAFWHKELREKLKRRTEHLDSPLLCAKAAIRFFAGYGKEEGEDLPVWAAETWPAWRDIRDKVQPEPVAEWVDDYLARDAAAWAKGHKGIVWCEHDAFGRVASKLAGMPYYGGRQSDPDIYSRDAEGNVTGISLDPRTSHFLSFKKYHEGVDGLQRLFTTQLIVNFPGLAKAVEQWLGRLHRIGQEADEVDAFLYRHTEELASAVDMALFQARYIQGTLGVNQKLLAAGRSWEK